MIPLRKQQKYTHSEVGFRGFRESLKEEFRKRLGVLGKVFRNIELRQLLLDGGNLVQKVFDRSRLGVFNISVPIEIPNYI